MISSVFSIFDCTPSSTLSNPINVTGSSDDYKIENGGYHYISSDSESCPSFEGKEKPFGSICYSSEIECSKSTVNTIRTKDGYKVDTKVASVLHLVKDECENPKSVSNSLGDNAKVKVKDTKVASTVLQVPAPVKTFNVPDHTVPLTPPPTLLTSPSSSTTSSQFQSSPSPSSSLVSNSPSHKSKSLYLYSKRNMEAAMKRKELLAKAREAANPGIRKLPGKKMTLSRSISATLVSQAQNDNEDAKSIVSISSVRSTKSSSRSSALYEIGKQKRRSELEGRSNFETKIERVNRKGIVNAKTSSFNNNSKVLKLSKRNEELALKRRAALAKARSEAQKVNYDLPGKRMKLEEDDAASVSTAAVSTKSSISRLERLYEQGKQRKRAELNYVERERSSSVEPTKKKMNPVTASRCNRLYELSKLEQEKGKQRREEIERLKAEAVIKPLSPPRGKVSLPRNLLPHHHHGGSMYMPVTTYTHHGSASENSLVPYFTQHDHSDDNNRRHQQEPDDHDHLSNHHANNKSSFSSSFFATTTSSSSSYDEGKLSEGPSSSHSMVTNESGENDDPKLDTKGGVKLRKVLSLPNIKIVDELMKSRRSSLNEIVVVDDITQNDLSNDVNDSKLKLKKHMHERRFDASFNKINFPGRKVGSVYRSSVEPRCYYR